MPRRASAGRAQGKLRLQATFLGQPTQQQPLTNVFSKMNTENEIDADFAAAFGHAGIPCDKLGHPSIIGLIQKYTDVAGCVRSPITLRKDPMQAQAHSQTCRKISGIFRNKLATGRNSDSGIRDCLCITENISKNYRKPRISVLMIFFYHMVNFFH